MEHSAAKSTPAIAIVRVSSTKQGLQGDSPEDQLRAIESLLPVRNDEIVEIFEWIESASEMTDQQPAWRAVEFCKKHPEVRRCYVKCMDRFTRGGADEYSDLSRALNSLNVFILDVYGIASDKQTNTMGHLGKKYKWSVFRPSYKAELLEAEKAKDEFRDIMTRLTTGSVNRVREGYAIGSPGYGYVNKRIENENGRKVYILVPLPEEAQYIRRMFELKAEGKTEVEIVKTINAMGFLSRTRYRRKKEGLRIVRAGKIGNVPLSKKQLQNFLKNPIYCGISTHSHLSYIEEKENSEKIEHFTPIVIKGEPLVSVDLWNRANNNRRMITVKDDGTAQIFKGKSLERYVKKSKRNKAYPYKEYLACHICHRVLKASAPRSKSGKHVPTYHCSTKHKYWGTNGAQLHKDIENFIHHLEFSDEFREQFSNIMLEEWEKRRDSVNQDSINYEKEVLRIKEEQRAILDTMKVVALASMRQAYEKQYEELEKKKTVAMSRRDTKEVEEINIQTVISYCNYFMEHLEELLLDEEKPLESARLFSLCFDEAPTVFEILDGTPRLSPLFKLNEAYKKDKGILSESGGTRTPDQ
ncbi:MAG: hypothetical protein BroJett025_10550 [Patescibacteria group bacterium]|nr:MAG: hypothetical protein BroJett025_10550 [Patescibacteria group bacterium]